MNNFNIFSTLSKDDKELIHSSFIKFLFVFDDRLYDFFKEGNSTEIGLLKVEQKNNKVLLEQSKSLGKDRKKYRLDIEVIGSKSILLIENKFKSFPYKEQLKAYTAILNQDQPALFHVRYLLCFDKEFAPKVEGWHVKDYFDLFIFIKANYNYVTGDEKILINHYILFLDEYIKDYETFKNNALILLDNERLVLYKKNITNKNFWLKLIYSGIGNYMLNNNLIFDRYQLGSGSTSLALIELFPHNWYNKLRILIQLQDSTLKLYCHPYGTENNKEDVQLFISNHQLIGNEIKKAGLFESFNPSYKNTTNLKGNTYYLVHIDLLSFFRIKGKSVCGMKDLNDCILYFYLEIDHLLKVLKLI